VHLRVVLNRILGVTHGSLGEHVVTTLVGRVLAAAFAIGIGLIMAAGMTASAAASYLARTTSNHQMQQLFSILQTTRTLYWIVVVLVFMLVLKYLPSRHPPWRHALAGAIVATVLFEFGKSMFSLYLAKSVIASAYGPSSAIVAILLWVYFSAQTFLIGAEVCRYRMDAAAERAKKVSE
jgi:membrane protein